MSLLISIGLGLLLQQAPEADAVLRLRLEKLKADELARLYYIDWGRDAAFELEDKIEESKSRPGQEGRIQGLEQAIAEHREIYSKHDAAKPLETVERLLRSKNRMISALGFKILTKGGFSEGLKTLKETDPSKVPAAERILKQLNKPWASTAPPERLLPRRLDAIRRAFKDIRDEGSRQPFIGLNQLTNVRHPEDVNVWEAWLKENEPYLACEPRLCEGLVYVDEEAKACAVPWAEWRKLDDAARAEKLKSATVRQGWKRVDLRIEPRGKRLVHGVEIDHTGSGFNPRSPSLAYWLHLQRALLAEWAPDWGLTVYVESGSDADEAARVKERCAALGFEAVLAK